LLQNHLHVEAKKCVPARWTPRANGASGATAYLEEKEYRVGLIVGLMVLAVVGAVVQLARDRRSRTMGRVAEVFLLWLLVVGAGVVGVVAFFAHTVLADQTARSIGWPEGNPFQTEVAMANLATAVLGILCFWKRGNFWTATVIATSVWLLGDAVVHVVQIATRGNYSPGNAGIPLYIDILFPLILIGLLIVYKARGEGAVSPRRTPRVS
jgi:uncharacterized protein DUF6790